MALSLFDIKDIKEITDEDVIIFKNEYVDRESFEMDDNEESILMSVCLFITNYKKCILYSPFEGGVNYYVDTVLDFIIIDSRDIIDQLIHHKNFEYEMMLAETDEDANFCFKCKDNIVYIEKYRLSTKEKIYDVIYTHEEFYNMMKRIYNYTYSFCEKILEKKYFDILIESKLIRKLS